MSGKKTLIILRHAQAKSAGLTENDHNRSLTLQGHFEAAGVGERLASAEIIPDYVLCSTAVRTRETLEEVKKCLAVEPKISYVPQIYNAAEGELIAHIAAVPEDVSCLLVIGHNPGLYHLALDLAKEGDKQMHDNLQMQFPTCSLAVISFEGSWHDIMSARSKLVLFAVPQ